eukprot:PLAT4280.1.p1 GENE.PLAT4280.1~~PLAT4280.1.p1  ORF type:complete len:744 (+),score=237.98 PLAT4280.1:2012-4243(+)
MSQSTSSAAALLASVEERMMYLLDRRLDGSGVPADSAKRVVLHKLRADLLQSRGGLASSAGEYRAALQLASSELPAVALPRLSVVLGLSQACVRSGEARAGFTLAQRAYEEAKAELPSLTGDAFRSSAQVLQLLRDRLADWARDGLTAPSLPAEAAAAAAEAAAATAAARRREAAMGRRGRGARHGSSRVRAGERPGTPTLYLPASAAPTSPSSASFSPMRRTVRSRPASAASMRSLSALSVGGDDMGSVVSDWSELEYELMGESLVEEVEAASVAASGSGGMQPSLVPDEAALRDLLERTGAVGGEIARLSTSARVMPALHALFHAYVGDDARAGRKIDGRRVKYADEALEYDVLADRSLRDGPSITRVELKRLAEDFGLLPALVSSSDLSLIFRYCLRSDTAGVSVRGDALRYPAFLDCMARLAVVIFSFPPHAEPHATTTSKLAALFEKHMSLHEPDVWRPRMAAALRAFHASSSGVSLSSLEADDGSVFNPRTRGYGVPKAGAGSDAAAGSLSFVLSADGHALLTSSPVARSLRAVFNFYRKLTASGTSTPLFDSIAAAQQRLHTSGFLKFCRDFDIVPSRLSRRDAAALFGVSCKAAVLREGPRSSRSISDGLQLPGFLDCIVRIAVQAFTVRGQSATQGDKLQQLLRQMGVIGGDGRWREKMSAHGAKKRPRNASLSPARAVDGRMSRTMTLPPSAAASHSQRRRRRRPASGSGSRRSLSLLPHSRSTPVLRPRSAM